MDFTRSFLKVTFSKQHGWLENPQKKCSFLDGEIMDGWGINSSKPCDELPAGKCKQVYDIFMCIYIYRYEYKYIWIYVQYIYIRMNIYIYICIYIYTCAQRSENHYLNPSWVTCGLTAFFNPPRRLQIKKGVLVFVACYLYYHKNPAWDFFRDFPWDLKMWFNGIFSWDIPGLVN